MRRRAHALRPRPGAELPASEEPRRRALRSDGRASRRPHDRHRARGHMVGGGSVEPSRERCAHQIHAIAARPAERRRPAAAVERRAAAPPHGPRPPVRQREARGQAGAAALPPRGQRDDRRTAVEPDVVALLFAMTMRVTIGEALLRPPYSPPKPSTSMMMIDGACCPCPPPPPPKPSVSRPALAATAPAEASAPTLTLGAVGTPTAVPPTWMLLAFATWSAATTRLPATRMPASPASTVPRGANRKALLRSGSCPGNVTSAPIPAPVTKPPGSSCSIASAS